MFLSQWHTILAIHSSWNYGRSLVLSDYANISRFISLHYVLTPLLFPFNNCTWKMSFRHTTILPDANLHPYFKIACVKSVLWLALISKVVNVSLSGGSLGYWTACNNYKRYCTLPYCDTANIQASKYQFTYSVQLLPIIWVKSNGNKFHYLMAVSAIYQAKVNYNSYFSKQIPV